jgi:3,4-dihydroxy 2-butanone 4-phosphate synthase/GTP cyclohydrolase II
MARTPQLLAFAAAHGLRCITIADLVRWRRAHDALTPTGGAPAANGAAAS